MAEELVLKPSDEHNRKLLDSLHPPGWVNPRPAGRYNLVVIGGGTAGLVTAAGAAGLGARVALVERRLLGGDCLNFGCVPSKALIRAARAAADARGAAAFGIGGQGELRVDFPRVMERMRRLRAGIAPHDGAERFRSLGVDVFLGEARFTGSSTIEVGGQTLRFSRACIATGSRPSSPPAPGLEEVGYLTNETVFSLEKLPEKLAVIGAGPIGCELAQTFARLGSEVHLVEAAHGILPREDREAAGIVEQALTGDGLRLHCCGKNLALRREAGGKRLTVDSHGEGYSILVDEVLVATGRIPNTAGLNLEAAGVEHDGAGVKVNDFLQTTNPRIFAAGDICSPYKFTHMADAHARIVIRNALFGFLPFKARTSKLIIPWCTYTDPEIARVGLHGGELAERGIGFETLKLPFQDLDRAILDGETGGLLQVLVEKRSDRILGATLVARHAGEMISELTLGMGNGVGLRGYSAAIHPYPTQAEIFRKAGDAYQRSRLTRRTRRILSWILARRR